MILDDILANKRDEVEARRRAQPRERLRDEPLYYQARRGFRAARASAAPPAVIAEIKRASPSRGVIRQDFDPPAHARSYAAAGATALSVLTDERFFQGALAHLVAVRAAVGLPCLRKDFVVDPWQIEEARAFGADAVLLIAAACDDVLGRELLAAAAAAGLDVLVEVHDERELEWALGAGASLVGVNNRDLRTFRTTLETTERLAPLVPPGVLLVAESGIRTRADVARMCAAGARALLVGEAFMAQPDPGAALRELLGCR
ncbi:MAG: indole-3-glycerol phosphate synthase TrpC [Candidatus Binatia bacterium]